MTILYSSSLIDKYRLSKHHEQVQQRRGAAVWSWWSSDTAWCFSGVRAISEPAFMKNRRNPFLTQEKELTWKTGVTEVEGRGCSPAERQLKGSCCFWSCCFMMVANHVNKVPCSITHMDCSVMSKLFKGNSPHRLRPVFKATVGLVFKNVERDLPLSIKE